MRERHLDAIVSANIPDFLAVSRVRTSAGSGQGVTVKSMKRHALAAVVDTTRLGCSPPSSANVDSLLDKPW